MTPAKFEVAMSNTLEGDAFTRKYITYVFDLKVKVTHDILSSTLYCHVTYAAAMFEVAMSNCFKTRCVYKKIPCVTLTVKVTQNVAQYPLHHVTYGAA